jgi:hypothetical protein
MFALTLPVNAQSTSSFAQGEAQRVYNLLNGLGCIGNGMCAPLSNFTLSSACDSQLAHLKCNAVGQLAHL